MLTNAKMMMSYLIEHTGFVKTIILFVFTALVFLDSPTIAAGKLDFLADEQFSGRDDLVRWAGYGEEKLSTVVISGKLLCHGVVARKRTSMHPNSVSGATVAVFCGSSAKTKKWWAKGRTDSSGNFTIDLPSHLHAIPNLEKICHVRVVHLPKTSPCRSRKHNKAIRLSSVGEGIRVYITNNIHLKTHKFHT